jgi:hypothetical protein
MVPVTSDALFSSVVTGTILPGEYRGSGIPAQAVDSG